MTPIVHPTLARYRERHLITTEVVPSKWEDVAPTQVCRHDGIRVHYDRRCRAYHDKDEIAKLERAG